MSRNSNSMTIRKPKNPAKNDQYAVFESALKTILSVPHSQIASALKKKKQSRKVSASRVANG